MTESLHHNITISQLAICSSEDSRSQSYSKWNTNSNSVLPSGCTVLYYMLVHNCSFSLSTHCTQNLAKGVSPAHTKTVIHSHQCHYTTPCYQTHNNIHTHHTNYLQPAPFWKLLFSCHGKQRIKQFLWRWPDTPEDCEQPFVASRLCQFLLQALRCTIQKYGLASGPTATPTSRTAQSTARIYKAHPEQWNSYYHNQTPKYTSIYKTTALTVFHMISSSQLCTHFLFPPLNYVCSVLETYFTNVQKNRGWVKVTKFLVSVINLVTIAMIGPKIQQGV